MELVPGLMALLQGLSATMTAPTFDSFTTLASGWVFASRRTVTRMICAAGELADKHYSSYHRVFSAACWSLDKMGLAVLDLMQPFLGETIMLALDDTLARKRGLKMFGCGMHHDPLLSSRGHTVTNWGHNWIVLAVIVELPFRPGHFYALPIMFRLYLNQKQAKRQRRVCRKRTELAVEMFGVLAKHRENQSFHVVADSAYGGKNVLGKLPENFDLTSRLVVDARLYEAPPERQAGAKGRPRVRGKKLPTPGEMLAGRCPHVALEVYGRTQKARIAECEARVFAVPGRALRVVAVDALEGGRGQEVFYSTRVEAEATQVIAWYAQRWSIEVSFHDSKQHLGFEEPQASPPAADRAVERTAPMAMLFYSLIVLWFAREGHRDYQPLMLPWYESKTDASFADMIGALRLQSTRKTLLSLPLRGPGSRKIKQLLENVVAMAA